MSVDVALKGRIVGFTLDAAFNLPEQGVTALFGPSGCGKTTILRCIAGLMRMDGHLKVGAETWQDSKAAAFLEPHKRPVGYVFQDQRLFPHLTVEENLMFGAKRLGRRRADVQKRFNEIVELLGCGPLLRRSVDGLSGGERQRVAIGRALLAEPTILLLDEPLSALDRDAKDDLLNHLEALHLALSIPVLYVSHDIAEVARLAPNAVVLSRGSVVASGETKQVFERLDLHPHTGRFEAGALVTTRFVDTDQTYLLSRLEHAGQSIWVPEVDARPGDIVRVRIRARDVALSLNRPEGISIRNILSGTIAEIREEPSTAFAEALVDIGGARLRARITRATVAELNLVPGKAVYALIKAITFDRRNVLTAASPHDQES